MVLTTCRGIFHTTGSICQYCLEDHNNVDIPDFEYLHTLRILGRGQRGEVRYDDRTGMVYKILHSEREGLKSEYRVAFKAATLMADLTPKPYAIDAERYILAYSPAKGTPAADALERRTEIRPVLLKVVQALHRFHDIGITHNDLHPKNVFIDVANLDRISIIDWGEGKLNSNTRTKIADIKNTLKHWVDYGSENSNTVSDIHEYSPTGIELLELSLSDLSYGRLLREVYAKLIFSHQSQTSDGLTVSKSLASES